MPAALPSAVLSALHVLALALGLPAIFFRARALPRGDRAAILAADNVWGVAAVLWLVSGLLRAFGGYEKGTDWYLHSPLFHLKMGLFLAIWVLELAPMIALVRWRRGVAPTPERLVLYGRLSQVELAITVVLPFVAAAMARGI